MNYHWQSVSETLNFSDSAPNRVDLSTQNVASTLISGTFSARCGHYGTYSKYNLNVIQAFNLPISV